jgi:CubicO group peptidase (beta-lactamase class C family)
MTSEYTYEELVQTYILDALNMSNTGFDFTQDVINRMAVTYISGQPVPPGSIGWAAPAGQAYSTTSGMIGCRQALM